jgi:hypothetical protein
VTTSTGASKLADAIHGIEVSVLRLPELAILALEQLARDLLDMRNHRRTHVVARSIRADGPGLDVIRDRACHVAGVEELFLAGP